MADSEALTTESPVEDVESRANDDEPGGGHGDGDDGNDVQVPAVGPGRPARQGSLANLKRMVESNSHKYLPRGKLVRGMV
jgi:hypothetical protein